MPLGTYWRTARQLSISQLAARAGRILRVAAPSEVECQIELSHVAQFWRSPIPKAERWRSTDTWVCHGSVWLIDSNRPWLVPGMPALQAYILHYLDDLSSTSALRDPANHLWLLDSWVGLHGRRGSFAWDPYPVSRRLVNVCKWAMSGGRLYGSAVNVLGSHAELLLRNPETDLRANHLLANAVALIFAGNLLSEPLRSRCARLGADILATQITKQVLPDGGHYERSPMYHATVLEDLLDARNVLSSQGGPLVGEIEARVPGMLRWLHAMTFPDGYPGQFNDTAQAEAPTLRSLLAYARRLDVPSNAVVEHGVLHLRESGFARVTVGAWTVIADIGTVGPDDQPGHAHAGTLSFEASLGAHRLIVNTGVSTYEPSARRVAERGTASHNTVEFDGADSSEVWASFRVGRRARVMGAQTNWDGRCAEIRARHDGYAWLRGRPIHERVWRINRGAIQIEDRVKSSGSHELRARIHVHPRFDVRHDLGRALLIFDPLGSGVARVDPGDWMSAAITDFQYSANFGITQAAKCIELRASTVGDAALRSSVDLIET